MEKPRARKLSNDDSDVLLKKKLLVDGSDHQVVDAATLKRILLSEPPIFTDKPDMSVATATEKDDKDVVSMEVVDSPQTPCCSSSPTHSDADSSPLRPSSSSPANDDFVWPSDWPARVGAIVLNRDDLPHASSDTEW